MSKSTQHVENEKVGTVTQEVNKEKEKDVNTVMESNLDVLAEEYKAQGAPQWFVTANLTNQRILLQMSNTIESLQAEREAMRGKVGEVTTAVGMDPEIRVDKWTEAQKVAAMRVRVGSPPLSPGTGNSVKIVKESSVKMSRLLGPNMFSSSSTGYKAMARSDSGRLQREEQVQEIIELKKALAKTQQDLQKTWSRWESQDNRSSSDEDTHHGYKRDQMVASMSGSMNAMSNKPCLNRELLAKLRLMTRLSRCCPQRM